jgi:hypothetical protein
VIRIRAVLALAFGDLEVRETPAGDDVLTPPVRKKKKFIAGQCMTACGNMTSVWVALVEGPSLLPVVPSSSIVRPEFSALPFDSEVMAV